MSEIPHKAFEKIYKKLSLPLTKFIAKRIGADTDALEEVFSRPIVAAWKGLKTFRHKSSYFTGLCRIALNKIADYYKDQVNQKSHIVVPILKDLSDLESDEASPEERFALKELSDAVNKCLDLLPPEKRRLLQLRYWREMTYAEISKILGISERAVEGKIYRAKKLFKKTFLIQYPELSKIYSKE